MKRTQTLITSHHRRFDGSISGIDLDYSRNQQRDVGNAPVPGSVVFLPQSPRSDQAIY